jgi:hypothetical protein
MTDSGKKHDKGEKKSVDVTIGTSKTRTRRVHFPGVSKVDPCPVNPQQAGWVDKFSIEVKKGEYFDVTRVDHDAGWGQPLVLRCRVRGDGKPVVSPDEEKKAWETIEGAATCIAMDAQGNAICCCPDGSIMEKPKDSKAWTKIDGAATLVARGADGTTWCVNSVQHIFRREGKAWKQMPGAASFIAVGSATEVVCINASMNIYKWNAAKNDWQALEGAAVAASIGSDGTFFVVAKTEEVFKKAATGNGFTKVTGKGKSVAVADKTKVFLTDSTGKLFKSADEGATWQPIEGNFRHVAAAPGHLVAANAANQLFHQHI